MLYNGIPGETDFETSPYFSRIFKKLVASIPIFIPENLLLPISCHFASGLKYENAVGISHFYRVINN